jgi:hypothetical protein
MPTHVNKLRFSSAASMRSDDRDRGSRRRFQRLQPIKILHGHHDDDRAPMHAGDDRHGLGAGKVDQPVATGSSFYSPYCLD